MRSLAYVLSLSKDAVSMVKYAADCRGDTDFACCRFNV